MSGGIRPAIVAGGLAGLAAGLVFASLHALLIVPIWDRMGFGLASAVIAGMVGGWAFAELEQRGGSYVLAGLRFGALLWLAVVPVTLADAALRVTGLASRFEPVDVVVALLLAVTGGALLGRWRVGSRRAMLAGASATLMLTVAMAGPVPIPNGQRAIAIFLAVLPACLVAGLVLGVSMRATVPTLLLAFLLAPLVSAPAQDPAPLRTERIAPGVHLIGGGEAGNVLVVVSADALLLVDARDTNEVAALDAAVRAISALPVRTVINTHYHFDHVGANAHFASRGATIMAHDRMPALVRVDTLIPEMNNWRRVAIAERGVPTRTFADTLALRFGTQRIILLHPPGAHTGGDVMVWLPDADVLHAGDIVEVGAPPFIDWWAGGSLDGMIAACDRILALAGPATRIVPGHGPVIGRDAVRDYRDMLATIRSRVGTALDSGRTREQLLESRPTAEFDERLGGEARAKGFTRLVWFGIARARNR